MVPQEQIVVGALLINKYNMGRRNQLCRIDIIQYEGSREMVGVNYFNTDELTLFYSSDEVHQYFDLVVP